MAEKVRYRVLKPVFVNNSIYDPKVMAEPFIMADVGLEGTALELAPEAVKPAPAPAKDKPAA